jgi:hypothetical protein
MADEACGTTEVHLELKHDRQVACRRVDEMQPSGAGAA